MFTHDFAPATEAKSFPLLPDGSYELQITNTEERKTSKGDPMVNVECEVINNPDYNGRRIFHNVSFLPKDKPGSGMSTHFLKSIGRPFEGTLDVDCSTWIGEKFRAKIGSREYTKKDGTKATVNDVQGVEALLPF